MRSLAPIARLWIAALGVAGTALLLPASAALAEPRPLGAVLTVPTESLGGIVAANSEDHVVSVLQVSHLDLRAPNSQVLTIRISPLARPVTARPGASLFCRLPRTWLAEIQQLNGPAVRNLSVDLATREEQELFKYEVIAEIADTGSVEMVPGARVLLVPLKSLARFRAVNGRMFRVLHMLDLWTGQGFERVAVVAVGAADGAGCALLSGLAAAIRRLNSSME